MKRRPHFQATFILLSIFFLSGITQAADENLKDIAAQKGLYVGTSVSWGYVGAAWPVAGKSTEWVTTYNDTMKKHYNMIVPDLLAPTVQLSGVYPNADTDTDAYNDFAVGDQMVAFAQANGMKIRGIPLVWGESAPAWLVNGVNAGTITKSQAEQILQNYVKTVVGHYKGKVYAWDVVNEAIYWENKSGQKTPWRVIGANPYDYVKLAFQWAREADPGAKLFYNDFLPLDQVYNQVKAWKDQGVPIDGVGIQSHIHIQDTSGSLAEYIRKFGELGLEVHITELDNALPLDAQGNATAAQLDAQGLLYEKVTAACVSSPYCKAIVTWGFTDDDSWINYTSPAGDGAALPFGKLFTYGSLNYFPIKPAFTKMLAALKSTARPFVPIRVAAGSTVPIPDSQQRAWGVDNGFSGGNVWPGYPNSPVVSGTSDPQLYKSERWNDNAFSYDFVVPNDTYYVTLKFSENYFTQSGKRIQNVKINGQQVLTNFDPAAAAGGPYKAVDKTFPVTVTGGQIKIEFIPVVSNPKINAIEISTVSPAPPAVAFTPIRLLAGSATAYTDAEGRVWSAASGFDSGNTYAVNTAVTQTIDPKPYQSERWSGQTFSYQTAVPNGNYFVRLKFAEIYFTQPGLRIQNVKINGQQVLTNFDPAAAAGGPFKAVDRTFPVTVTGGQIKIEFIPVISNPKISAIEIFSNTPAPASFTSPIRVLAGQTAPWTDGQGKVWSPDSQFSVPSSAYCGASGDPLVSNTADPQLYKCERWHSAPFEYVFTVPNGTYKLKLKFAEIYFRSSGLRIQNVYVNGDPFLVQFDAATAAGGSFRAYDAEMPVAVTNGRIKVRFVPVISNPKISAIEIS